MSYVGLESYGIEELKSSVFQFSIFFPILYIGESKKGRMADALAHGGDEGRDKLR